MSVRFALPVRALFSMTASPFRLSFAGSHQESLCQNMTANLANNLPSIRGLLKSQFGIKSKHLKIVMVRTASGEWCRPQIHIPSKCVIAHMERLETLLSNACGVRNRAFRDFSRRRKQVVDDGMDERFRQRSVRILDDHDDIPGPGGQTFPCEIRREIVSGSDKAIGYPGLMRKTFARHQNRFRNGRKLFPTHRELPVTCTQGPQQPSQHIPSL